MILSVPSGDHRIEITMKVHEALYAGYSLNKSGQLALSQYRDPPEAQIVRFPKAKARRARP